MASVTFHLNQTTGNKASRLRLYFSYKPGINAKTIRLRFSTPYKLKPQNWNKRKQQATGHDSVRINQQLQSWQSDIYNWFTGNPKASQEELSNAINAILSPEQSNDTIKPLEALQRFVELKRTTAKKSAYNIYRQQLDELQAYDSHINWQDLKNSTFWQYFQSYLLEKKTVYGTGLRNKSIVIKIKALNRMLKWCVKAGYTDSIAELDNIVSAKTSDIIVLSQDEILQIRAAELPKRYQNTRDIFLFQFYTGQRYSDICRLNTDQITGNIWQFEAKKTGKVITIPLTGFAATALDILVKHDYKLPLIGHCAYNIHVKEICKLAGITDYVKIREYKGANTIEHEVPKYKMVSSHTARRSCITFLLSRGVPPTTVMELTGHSDMKTLMKYYKPSPDFLVRAFEAVGELGQMVVKNVS